MKTIWKFELEIADWQKIDMPSGAEILAYQYQQSNFRPAIWAMVEASAPKASRICRVFGTGHPITALRGEALGELTYIGTFQVAAGTLVFHCFEEHPQPQTGDQAEAAGRRAYQEATRGK